MSGLTSAQPCTGIPSSTSLQFLHQLYLIFAFGSIPNNQPMGSNPPTTKIEDSLYLGDSVSSRRSGSLEEQNIAAVVPITHGRWVHWIQPWYKEIIPDDRHIFIPANDSMTQDLLPDLTSICDFIN
jgi:hypothetical protein